MPPLPGLFGLMMFGDPTFCSSEKPGAPQRLYHKGDDVGPFKLIAFDDTRRVTLEWNGKTIEKPLEDLVNQAAVPPCGSAPAPSVRQHQAAQGGTWLVQAAGRSSSARIGDE